MASSLPSSSTQTRTSAPRRPAAAATVRSTMSDRLLVDGDEHVDGHAAGRRPRPRARARSSRSTRSRAPGSVLKISAAIRSPYRYGVPIAVGVQQPAEVPDGRPAAREIRHDRARACARSTVVGTGCHVTCRSRTSQGGCSSELPDHGLRRLEAAHAAAGRSRAARRPCSSGRRSACCPGTRRARTPGSPPSRLAAPWRSGRLAKLGRVVLEHVAHVGRLVRDEAVRPGVRLDLLDRAAEVVQARVAVVRLLVGQTPSSKVSMTTPAASERALGFRIQPVIEPRDQEQQQRHRDEEVAHLEQRAIERRDDDQENHDGMNAARREDQSSRASRRGRASSSDRAGTAATSRPGARSMRPGGSPRAPRPCWRRPRRRTARRRSRWASRPRRPSTGTGGARTPRAARAASRATASEYAKPSASALTGSPRAGAGDQDAR